MLFLKMKQSRKMISRIIAGGCIVGILTNVTLFAFATERVYCEKEGLSDEELYGDSAVSILAPETNQPVKKDTTVPSSGKRQEEDTSISQKNNTAKEEIQKNAIKKVKQTDTNDKKLEDNAAKEEKSSTEEKKDTTAQENAEVRITMSGVEEEKYYNSDVNLNIEVENPTFDENQTSVTAYITDEENGLREKPLAFSQDGRIYNDSFTLQEEGEYKVVVSVKEGDTTKQEDSRHFYIDKTAPVITLDTLEEETNQIDVPKIKRTCVKDSHLAATKLYVNGVEEEEIVQQPGEYHITVAAQDAAGNEQQNAKLIKVVEKEECTTAQNSEIKTGNAKEKEQEKQQLKQSLTYHKAILPAVVIISVMGGVLYQKERKNTKKWEEKDDEGKEE